MFTKKTFDDVGDIAGRVIGFVAALAIVVAVVVGFCGCATTRVSTHGTRGTLESGSARVLGMFSEEHLDVETEGAVDRCVRSYEHQRASGGGTVPNAYGVCANYVEFGAPHPTWWGYGFGMGNIFAPGAPVRW